MSKSTPLKRKKTSKNLRPTLYISSDSDDESPQKIYQPKSLKLSEKRRKNIPIQERTDEIEAYYLIQFLGKKSEYGIVSDKSIILDDENTQIGTVKHYSKSYPVKIIKKGTLGYIEKLAEKFKFNLSLNTSEESEADSYTFSNQKHADSQNGSNSQEINLMDEDLLENYPRQNSYQISLLKENQDQIARQQASIDALFKKISELDQPKEKISFIFSGVDLIKDIHGYPAHQWASNCLKILFSKEEAKNYVLVSTNKSNRPACCPIKVNLLKEALKFKYSFPAEKEDKVWKKVISAFNSKGRGLKTLLADRTNFSNRNN